MTDAHAELQDLIERNLREAARTEAAMAEVMPKIEAVVGRGTSRSGVRASVDHRGIVTDLALSPASVDLPLDELRTEVLASVGAAVADAQAQAAPLQAQVTAHARPLDDTSVLDALDRIARGETMPPTDRRTGGHQ
jgi:hypothetical protein